MRVSTFSCHLIPCYHSPCSHPSQDDMVINRDIPIDVSRELNANFALKPKESSNAAGIAVITVRIHSSFSSFIIFIHALVLPNLCLIQSQSFKIFKYIILLLQIIENFRDESLFYIISIIFQLWYFFSFMYFNIFCHNSKLCIISFTSGYTLKRQKICSSSFNCHFQLSA